MERQTFLDTQEKRFNSEIEDLALAASKKVRTYRRKADWISSELTRCFSPGMNVFEVGVGPGILSQLVYQRFPLASFFATDAFPEALECAGKRLSGLANVQFAVWDVEKPAPEGFPKFDFLFGCDVLHHVSRPRKALYHLLQVARKGATLCLLETNPLNPWLGLVVGSHPEESRLWLNHPRSFCRWLDEAGWKVQRVVTKPAFLPSGPASWGGVLDYVEELIFRLPFFPHIAGMYELVCSKERD